MATAYKPVARNFVNFDDYLAQNDPTNLVQSATGGLGQKAGQLQSDIQKAQTGFAGKAVAGTGGTVTQGPAGAPWNFTAHTATDEADAKRIVNTGYSGPRTLAEAMGRDVSNEVGDVTSRVKGLGSAAGRMTLLQEQQKNQPGYTRGMSAYDAALLGGSQQGQKAIGNLQQNYGGLDTFLGKAQKQTGETAAEVEGLMQGVKGSAQDYLTKVQGQREGAEAQAAQKAAEVQRLKDEITSLNAQINDPGTNPADRPALAAQRDELMKKYNPMTGSGWRTGR